MLYFGLCIIIYQISIFNWYLIIITHDSLFNIRDIPIYLGIRLFVVLFILMYSFFMYYVGTFRILYFIYNILINYIYILYILFINSNIKIMLDNNYMDNKKYYI